MISVTLFGDLAARSRSKRKEFHVPFGEGMTALDIVKSEFDETLTKSIMVVVNGHLAPIASKLTDGDMLILVPRITGG